MRNVLLMCLLCCILSLTQLPSAAEASDPKWEEPTRWQTIDWQPDTASAIREANLSGKPLMVFMIVNYKGRPGADKA